MGPLSRLPLPWITSHQHSLRLRARVSKPRGGGSRRGGGEGKLDEVTTAAGVPLQDVFRRRREPTRFLVPSQASRRRARTRRPMRCVWGDAVGNNQPGNAAWFSRSNTQWQPICPVCSNMDVYYHIHINSLLHFPFPIPTMPEFPFLLPCSVWETEGPWPLTVVAMVSLVSCPTGRGDVLMKEEETQRKTTRKKT